MYTGTGRSVFEVHKIILIAGHDVWISVSMETWISMSFTIQPEVWTLPLDFSFNRRAGELGLTLCRVVQGMDTTKISNYGIIKLEIRGHLSKVKYKQYIVLNKCMGVLTRQ